MNVMERLKENINGSQITSYKDRILTDVNKSNKKEVSFMTKIDRNDVFNPDKIERVTMHLIKQANDDGIDISNDFERVVGYEGEDCRNNQITVRISYYINL